jgi:four helix bundle protein
VATVKSFEELDVWKEACRFVVDIYNVSSRESSKFDYDLSRQIRRASISIPSNIAEGFEKNSEGEFIRYLLIAKGSAGEVRTQLYLAKSLNFLSSKDFDKLKSKIIQISSMISGLITYLKSTKK